VDNGLVAVLGRQVKGGKGKPVEGFPNGLPDLTPLGVRITLENMLGKPQVNFIFSPFFMHYLWLSVFGNLFS
jgi:hypothetical protein